jgi:hypothetical protein
MMNPPTRRRLAVVALLPSLLWASMSGAAPVTRSFVLSWFYPAMFADADTCPAGLNPSPDVFFKRDLKLLGVPQTEVDAAFDKDYNQQNARTTTNWVKLASTRGNGVDNVYLHPTTVPDSHLKSAVGRYGYGFNLDGRGALSPNSYENPESHEKGVNNQLFRALGCIPVYKALPPPQPPLEPEYRWGSARAAMGAWLISITGADLTHDGEVTVTLENSIDPVTTQDANARVQGDMTYRVLAESKTRNVLRGHLTDGVITTEPASLRMACDSYIQPTYEFKQARLRLRIKPDGTLAGMLGGYQPWLALYWSHAKVGYIDERGFGVDAPALYYALRNDADADPDPVTGGNRAISAAYVIDAVPAFVTTVEPPDVRAAAAPPAAADPPVPADPPAATDRTGTWGALFERIVGRREPRVPGAPPLARRLRPDQYRRVIADVFGPTIRVEGRFEPDVREDGLFAIGVAHVGLTATGMEQYDAMARGIAEQVVSPAHRATLIPCRPQGANDPDDACARRFFAAAGPLLYRRPLSPDELDQDVRVARESAAALHDFYAGLGLSLAGMLESPPFLFREERPEADPEHPGQYRLDAFSKASALSFFLWNSGPDAALQSAAAGGELDTAAGLERQVDRMLRSPRLEAGVRAFFADMLQFDLFDTLAKDAQIYPKWTAQVAADAQEQTLRTIVHGVLTERGDYRDLFTTRDTFLTPLLGSLYGLPVAPLPGGGYRQMQLAAGDPHTGIHTHASFVALHSHEGVSSPTLRGKALRELLLCEPVPAPPGNVNFAIAQDTHNPNFKTMRDRLTAHRTDPACAGCHKLMDPMGLALENFASDAGYRTAENGKPLDTSGELDGVTFDDPVGLGRALHDNPGTGACLVRRLYSYATGRTAERRDMPWIRHLEQRFAEDGYRPPALMREIATSPNFYRVTLSRPALVARDSSL